MIIASVSEERTRGVMPADWLERIILKVNLFSEKQKQKSRQIVNTAI